MGGQAGNQNAAKMEMDVRESNAQNDDFSLTISFDEDTKEPITPARQIANEQSVSVSTVQRAAKVADAFERLDVTQQKQFLSGKLKPTEILKKAAPRKTSSAIEPAFEPGKSIETQMIESQARRYSLVIGDFCKKTQEINNSGMGKTANIPRPLVNFISNLEKICQALKLDVSILKAQFICEECLGAKCDACVAGFVDHVVREYQLRQIEKDPAFKGRNRIKTSLVGSGAL